MPRRLSLLAPKRLLKPPKNSKQSCCAARTPSPRFFLCGFCSVWRGRPRPRTFWTPGNAATDLTDQIRAYPRKSVALFLQINNHPMNGRDGRRDQIHSDESFPETRGRGRRRHTKNKARTGVCAPHGVGRILGLPLVLVLGLSLLIVLGLRVARAGFHPAPIARDDLTGVLDRAAQSAGGLAHDGVTVAVEDHYLVIVQKHLFTTLMVH